MSRLRFRRDLVCKRIRMGSHTYWVLKDPLSRTLQHVGEDEYRILSMLDGICSPQEIMDRCRKSFASHYVASAELLHFLAESKRRNLVVDVDGHTSDASTQVSPRSPWWTNALALRLPGIRPDRLLALIEAVFGPAFNASGILLLLSLWIIGGIATVVQWQAITGDIGAAFVDREARTFVAFIVVIAVVKIIHELAHAVVCKRMGSRCHEIGVMFLFGVPCLYCDVSDAWLLPERYRRILISAAGILAELTIAAIAVILWSVTADLAMRQWCLVVMVVCSVNTLIVNGNPLMRYDGYFIFSDLVGVPNLASKASASLRQYVRGVLHAEPAPSDWHHRLLAVYAVASGCFRTIVLGGIAIAILRYAFDSDLTFIGVFAISAVGVSMALPTLRSYFGSSRQFCRVRQRTFGPMVKFALLAVLLLLFFVPLPRSVTVPATIRPADAKEIVLSVEGRLFLYIAEGVEVRRGESIAEFTNDDLVSQLSEAQSQHEKLTTEESNLKSRRSSGEMVSSAIATTVAAKQGVAKRIEMSRDQVARLTIVASEDGTLYDPARRPLQPLDDHQAEGWVGVPLAESNIGAWMQAGTDLCVLGHPSLREAILMVGQESVSLVHTGQQVRLKNFGIKEQSVIGEVIEVGAAPSKNGPPELISTRMIDVSETLYPVRVRLAKTIEPITIRATAYATIDVQPASISSRVRRVLTQSIRW